MANNPIRLETRAGFKLDVRPVDAADTVLLGEFFKHVTKEDLRFRYLVGIDHVSEERIAELVHVDHARKENFLAFAEGGAPLVATALLACDPQSGRAEVAITIREDFKALGIGWELLSHLAGVAKAKGARILESVEQRENHAAIELERHMGFSAHPDPDDPTLLVLRKDLTGQDG